MEPVENNSNPQQQPTPLPKVNQTPLPTPLGKKRIPKVILIIVILILLSVCGVAGFFVYQNSKTQTSLTIPHTTASSPTHDAIPGWEIYSNDKYGFQLQYPASLFGSPKENTPEKSGANSYHFYLVKTECHEAFCPPTESFSIEINPTELTFEEWIQSNLMTESRFSDDGKWISNGVECYDQSKQEQITVDSIEASSYKFSWNQLGHPHMCRTNVAFDEDNETGIVQYIFFYKNNAVYKVDMRYVNNSEFQKTLNQILSSLQLTETILPFTSPTPTPRITSTPNANTGWSTYTSSKFTFKYPDDKYKVEERDPGYYHITPINALSGFAGISIDARTTNLSEFNSRLENLKTSLVDPSILAISNGTRIYGTYGPPKEQGVSREGTTTLNAFLSKGSD